MVRCRRFENGERERIILETEKVNLVSQQWSNRHRACFRLAEWFRLPSAPLNTSEFEFNEVWLIGTTRVCSASGTLPTTEEYKRESNVILPSRNLVYWRNKI